MKRYVIKIYGTFEGVEVNSYIYHQAIKYQLKGFVKHCSDYILLDCEGEKENIRLFLLEVIKNPPSIVEIEKVRAYLLALYHYRQFSIVEKREN